MSTPQEILETDISSFCDTCGSTKLGRLEQTGYGRLQAIIHTDFIRGYVQKGVNVLDAGANPG